MFLENFPCGCVGFLSSGRLSHSAWWCSARTALGLCASRETELPAWIELPKWEMTTVFVLYSTVMSNYLILLLFSALSHVYDNG